MSNKGKILIVEGRSDKFFFEALFKKINLDIEVKVNTPTDHGSPRDGKEQLFKLLKILIKQLADGTTSHLAIILDADYKENDWGFEVTLKKIKKTLCDNGYNEPSIQYGGLSFSHDNGLNYIGLWIMPDNESEGMFEDWIKKSVQESEKPLLEFAVSTIKNLPILIKKFKSIHDSKAEVATWMAWQKIPPYDFDDVIENLLNFQCTPMIQLVNWLKYIYSAHPLSVFQSEVSATTCENLQ